MSKALRIFQGEFGRVALLDMDAALVVHAHPHCHVLIKAWGADSFFLVKGELQPLSDETAVLVNTWESHAYAHRETAPHTTILALYIEPCWLAEVHRELRASSMPGFFPRPCVELPPATRRLADQLTASLLYAPDAQAEQEELLFDLMIAVIERHSEWRSYRGYLFSAPSASDFRIRRSIDYMRSNIGREFILDEVARVAGLSRVHFFRRFRQCTNLTPHLYFNVLRMEHAILALAESEEPLAELSGRLGFTAQGHFTRFFRNNQGIVPSEYRRVVKLIRQVEQPHTPG